jgi:hypothetical protein
MYGLIYVFSTLSFMLDISLTSRYFSLEIFVQNNNPDQILDFGGRTSLVFISFVYGVRCLHFILRWTLSRQLSDEIKNMVLQDSNMGSDDLDSYGRELAEAHSILHTKIGVCVVTFFYFFQETSLPRKTKKKFFFQKQKLFVFLLRSCFSP